MTRLELLVIAVVLGTLALVVPSAKISNSSNPIQESSQSTDTTFVQTAGAAGFAEVKLGQLAEQKGSTRAVRDFGNQIVTDHSNAGDQLKAIATRENISLPATLNPGDQATYDRLSKLSGADFDAAFVQQMVQDHQLAVSLFQQEANNSNDSALKNFATLTLPTLQSHLQMAKQMQKAPSGSSRSRK